MDVAIKGLFWLLEACRTSPTFQQFILIGGDAGVGHCIYPHPIPVTETQKHSAYPGCYALSKVLEEVMLEQYYIQYDFNGCCLRAPWIMEKDDFKYQLSFGEDVFGGPRWRDLVGAEQAEEYIKTQTIPVMLDAEGRPIKRNFVHVEDLVSAILQAIDHPQARQQTFNICMDEHQLITATWGLIWLSLAACQPWELRPPITLPGWITPKPSFCWVGGLNMISKK
jgi:nucleoside-diphosphate-sugar epimerase